MIALFLSNGSTISQMMKVNGNKIIIKESPISQTMIERKIFINLEFKTIITFSKIF